MSEQVAIKNVDQIKALDFSSIELKKEPTSNSRFFQIESEDGNLKLRVVESVITREKSEYKGFTYFVPQFDTIGTVLAFLGEDTVLDLVNAKLATLVATRATNRIDREVGDKKEGETDEAYNTRRSRTIGERLLRDAIAFTPSDAVQFVPGERELSLSSLLAKINKLNKLASEKLAANDTPAALEIYASIAKLHAMAKELIEKLREQAAAE